MILITLIITVGVCISVGIISYAAVAVTKAKQVVAGYKQHVEFLNNHVERHSNCRKDAENHIVRLYKTSKGTLK